MRETERGLKESDRDERGRDTERGVREGGMRERERERERERALFVGLLDQ